MPVDLSDFLVVAISSRALFDLEKENAIFEADGGEAFREHQIANEEVVLEPGTGFPLVRALLGLNVEGAADARRVEVVVVSRNSADAGLRVRRSITAHGLDISRMTFSKGEPVAKYLAAFEVDLFLTANEEDVRNATDAGYAAGLIYSIPKKIDAPLDQIRIAFDGDAVLFSDESEQIFQKQGIDAFMKHEEENAQNPLPKGPFAKLLGLISEIQKEYPEEKAPIRTALVTARNAPADERVVRTLRAWGVRVDESFFMGGVAKTEILKAFRPHIFFDDQHGHCDPASSEVPTARVIPERERLQSS